MQKKSAREVIYNSVLESILSLEYTPENIINEGELAHKFNCSKAPVREALASLCDARILQNIPRYGYKVIAITYEDIREVLQFRYLLEGGMMKKNYRQYDPAALESLAAINRRYMESVQSHDDFWQFNAEFHLTLMSLGGNRYAQEMLRVTLDKLQRAWVQVEWYRRCLEYPPAGAANHLALLDSLQKRDIASALEALRNDLGEFCDLHYDVGDFL